MPPSSPRSRGLLPHPPSVSTIATTPSLNAMLDGAYAITPLQHELGLDDVNQLWDTYRRSIADRRRQDRLQFQPGAREDSKPTGWSQTYLPFQPPPIPPTAPQPKLKTLAAYLDLEKVRDLGCVEIEAVWRLRHASSKHSLCASIPSSTFSRMAKNARRHPRFILPLPVGLPQASELDSAAGDSLDKGVSFHFVEWSFPSAAAVTVIMTHLAEFKTKGEFAIPHTAITHHLELAKDKGVVLLQGAVTENTGVSVEDARWLLVMLQRFYGGVGASDAERVEELLESFTAGDEAFRVEDLIDEAERIA
ncbi:hypothetical protein LOY94_001655 [Ophidiomyces ophidiicola]|nr:hypothetical protein LOZ62_001592 [Ophidiomyces ophidiicola]KAI2055214.1 hypothetical protein LOZ38_000813 [Ophidiomyces ophidiicola]KAI2080541.1 hypothetical protein LOZ37_001541 [Ophidiomyces ophidiicola]KAI2121907.1 hypothetical protein LOZ32_002143 [Ophidiomyces ophidiicola]KAI2127158.1 hypothetical protein LOZ31_002845 [Ophidiomyces ophidiicola]